MLRRAPRPLATFVLLASVACGGCGGRAEDVEQDDAGLGAPAKAGEVCEDGAITPRRPCAEGLYCRYAGYGKFSRQYCVFDVVVGEGERCTQQGADVPREDGSVALCEAGLVCSTFCIR